MEAIMSGRFIMGVVVGALLYHLYMMKMKPKSQ